MLILKIIIAYFFITTAACFPRESWSASKLNLAALPPNVIDDMLAILVYGTVSVGRNCSTANGSSEIQYWLYTRNNPNISVQVTSFHQVNGSKPIILLMHGWGGNGDINYINAIKNAYLKRYDCNIVSVNYKKYADTDYLTAYCQLPSISSNVAQFICLLSTNLNIKLENMHIVGHSLGGQLAGLVGSKTQKICGKLGRITGLDPAGPLFQDTDLEHRLDSSDATFVDVIHTNQGQYGYTGSCGDVDFYPNCGYVQPGCQVFSLLEFMLCNHQRSCHLFAESIADNGFYSTSCTLCGTPSCFKDIIFRSYAYMGESGRSKPRDRKYLLKTSHTSPYALGPKSPLDCKLSSV